MTSSWSFKLQLLQLFTVQYTLVNQSFGDYFTSRRNTVETFGEYKFIWPKINLVVAKVSIFLAVCKQEARKSDVEISSLRKVSEMEVSKQYQIKISNRFAALENMNDSEDLKENIETSGKTV